MEDKVLYNDILHLVDSFIFSVDMDKSIASEAYYGENLIGKNMSYKEIAHAIADVYQLKDCFQETLYRFISSVNLSDEITHVSLNYEDLTGQAKNFVYRIYYKERTNVLFMIYPTDKVTIHNDELTKTVSRFQIESQCKNSINNKEPFLLMIFSLDNFKAFTLKYGRLYSDILLIEAVASIKKMIGNDGLIARATDSQFMIYARTESDYDKIHEVCSKIKNSVVDLNLHNIKQIEITATIGTSCYPMNADNFDDMLRMAESAYRRGLNKGGKCFIIYTKERCGEVGDEKPKYYSLKNTVVSENNGYNIASGIIEILNRESDLSRNIEDSLSLLGNYYQMDRIIFVRVVDNSSTSNIVWIDPRNTNSKRPRISDQNINLWHDAYDTTGLFMLNQVEANQEHPLYEMLHEAGTTSILSFQLTVNDTNQGSIIFEMNSKSRFWTRDEISSLRLIARVMSIKISKEMDNEAHYRSLYYDEETDLYNYKKWRMEVTNVLSKGQVSEYSLMEMRIIDFASIRSLIGNVPCNKIFREIANKLRCYDDIGIIYCHDMDDKFLIFFPHGKTKEISSVFNEIANYITNNSPVKRTSIILHAGVYICNDNSSLEDALVKTEIAVKNSIIQKLVYFSDELYTESQERIQYELHMRDALKNNEFLLYLQPKINSLTGKLVGAEALTRWNYNFQKMVYPNSFIPLFEETGLIEDLDYTVFENVCKYQRSVIDADKIPVPISVNISRYVSDFTLYLWKLNAIKKKYNIPDGLIEIEITEGMYVNNDAIISEFIQELHKSGYRVSMDDFGSGYSNLSSLSTLNFDTIKLDKSFCTSPSEKDTIILSSIVSMIRNLNMSVLCEGVETKDRADFLKTVGCYIIQGYLYDKPLFQDDFRKKYVK